MNFLSWERPNGNAIAEKSDDPDQRNEKTFRVHFNNVLVSISSTFLHTNFSYERRFSSFFLLRFGFGKKFIQKMCSFSVDEMDGRVHFNNILRTHFSYQCALQELFLVTFGRKKHFRMKNACLKCWWNWHLQSSFQQHFTNKILINILSTKKITKTSCNLRKAVKTLSYKKNVTKMLMKQKI